MFYQFDDDVTTIDYANINSHLVTAGYLTKADCSLAGVEEDDVPFGAFADVFEDKTILRLCNADYMVKMVVKKELLIVVDFSGGSFVRDSFMQMLGKYSPVNISISKLLFAFFTILIDQNARLLDDLGIEITELEEAVLNNKADDKFNFKLLRMKKSLLIMLGFYKQLLGVCDALLENENEILTEDLNFVENLNNRAERIKADINSLQNAVVHLQDAYSSYLELMLNKNMKIFTVITTVFFPLTVITSWYGMNFKYMPELNFRFGYLFVIGFSISVISTLILIGKKHHWF